MPEQLMSNQNPPDKELIMAGIKEHLSFLLEEPIWIAHKYIPKEKGGFTKPPVGKVSHGQTQRNHTVSGEVPGYTFEEACEDGYPGIKLAGSDIIVLDIDNHDKNADNFNIADLNPDFREFLIQQDSYMERSISGAGLHVLFRCENKDDLPGRKNLNIETTYKGGGEIFSGSGFVAITGFYEAGSTVQTVEPYQLKQWYEMSKPKAEVIDLPVEFKDNDIPTLKEVKKILGYCKLNQCDRVKTAYRSITNEEYDHYYYWLKILAACHQYAEISNQKSDMPQIIVEWSRTDKLKFTSDDDVMATWESFSNPENREGMTYKTLLKFGKLLKFQWPVEKYVKGIPSGKPVPSDLINFNYLLDYYEMKFYFDIFKQRLYISCDKDVMDEYFEYNNVFFGMYGPFKEKELDSAIISFAQQNGYSGIVPHAIKSAWKECAVRRLIQFNSFKLWLETPPEELPEDMQEPNTDISKSNIDFLESCITFKESQNTELARIYLEAFFHGMVMPLYNTHNQFAHRSFVLLLTGPEAIRKTTFCGMLFPPQLRDTFITMSTETLGGGKSDRDFKTLLVESVLTVLDEFEHMFTKKNGPMLKHLITTDKCSGVPIYGKHVETFIRNAALIATTNENKLPMEAYSNRRMAILAVKWLDTDSISKINWHHFYRSFYNIGKKAFMNGEFPWQIAEEIKQLQYQENEKHRSETDLEINLKEIFDFNIPASWSEYDKGSPQLNKNLYGIGQIKGLLEQRSAGYIKPSALQHELRRVCGIYTNTLGKKKKLKYAGFIEDGIIKSSNFTKYVLPPIKTNFEMEREENLK